MRSHKRSNYETLTANYRSAKIMNQPTRLDNYIITAGGSSVLVGTVSSQQEGPDWVFPGSAWPLSGNSSCLPQPRDLHVRLTGNSKVVVGVNVSLNACVSLSDSHMTQLWLVQVYTASGLRSNNILKTNRQRKQSCTSQFVLMIFLDPVVFCSSRKPHVGRAQM